MHREVCLWDFGGECSAIEMIEKPSMQTVIYTYILYMCTLTRHEGSCRECVLIYIHFIYIYIYIVMCQLYAHTHTHTYKYCHRFLSYVDASIII